MKPSRNSTLTADLHATLWQDLQTMFASGFADHVRLWDTHTVAAWPTLCPAKRLLGLPCPGCGMGRALAYAAAGEFSASFKPHPGLFPLLGGTATWAFAPSLWRRALMQPRAARMVPFLALLLLIAWWVKNLYFL